MVPAPVFELRLMVRKITKTKTKTSVRTKLVLDLLLKGRPERRNAVVYVAHQAGFADDQPDFLLRVELAVSCTVLPVLVVPVVLLVLFFPTKHATNTLPAI